MLFLPCEDITFRVKSCNYLVFCIIGFAERFYSVFDTNLALSLLLAWHRLLTEVQTLKPEF